MEIQVTITISEREKQILHGLSRGRRHKEIAADLSLGRTTVEAIIQGLRVRYGCTTTAELIAFCYEKQILPLNMDFLNKTI